MNCSPEVGLTNSVPTPGEQFYVCTKFDIEEQRQAWGCSSNSYCGEQSAEAPNVPTRTYEPDALSTCALTATLQEYIRWYATERFLTKLEGLSTVQNRAQALAAWALT